MECIDAVRIPAETNFIIFITASRLILGPNQPMNQWVQEFLRRR